MSIRRFVLASAVSAVVALFALAGVARAGDSLWQTDFAAAKAKAKAEKKFLLVDFTGSDWCGWCKKLVAEVFSKDAFKTEAPKKFVLVELDYPSPEKQKKQPEKLQKQNEKLLKQYKVQGFPMIFIMDPEGKVVAQTGYKSGGPEKYVKNLLKLLDVHEEVDKLTKDLPKAKGIDRARLLDRLVDNYITLSLENDEISAWDKEIVKLDADNKAGLRVKHEYRLYMAEFAMLAESGNTVETKKLADKMLALPGLSATQQFDVYFSLAQMYQANKQFSDAGAAADKALAVTGITAEEKQQAAFPKCVSEFQKGDFVNVIACAKKGIEADPNGDQVEKLKSVIAQVQPMADAQVAIAKFRAEAANQKGLDRAKTLDKLIEAWDKVGGRSRDVSDSQVEKWAAEIVTLDADNKAKLKVKYQFRKMITEAAKLEKRPADYRAAIEKALALPGLTGEQIQVGRLALASSYLKGSDLKNGFDQLQKAYDAAPTTQRGKMIQAYIEQIKQQMGASKPSK